MAERLTMTPRDGLGIASVMARKGVDAAAIGAALGVEMPGEPRAVRSPSVFTDGSGADGPAQSSPARGRGQPKADGGGGWGNAPVQALPSPAPTRAPRHLPLAGEDARWTVIGTGPGTWLVVAEDAPLDFAEALATSLAGLASVSDQSSSCVVQRLSGPNARTVLQRGAAIDLHPDSFGPGSAATTVIAHIGVILWQVDEQPSYDVATFRSYAGSFRHWLDAGIAALRAG